MAFPELPLALAHALDGAALVPAPEVLLRLMRAVEDEGCSLEQLVAIVDKDPAIAARILAAANSSAFHRGRVSNSLEACLQILGLRVVRSIAVCLSVQCVFSRQSDHAQVELADFWYHSLLAAELARDLAVASGYARSGEAYLGALLHDIGELALLSALRGEYAAVLRDAKTEEGLSALEFERLGATHAEVGAWLVDRWHLDSALADSVLFHHASPVQIGDASELPRLVWCAHLLASGPIQTPPALVEQVARVMAVPAAEVGTLLMQAQMRVTQLASAMGIEIPEALGGGLPMAVFPESRVLNVATNSLVESMAETAILQALQRDVGAGGGVELLVALGESLRILFGIEAAAFLHYMPAESLLCGVTGQHAALADLRLPIANSASLAVRALRERRMVDLSAGDGRPTALADIQICRALQSTSLLCVPLLRSGQPLGVLLLGTSVAQQKALHARADWLQSFARIAASGLEMALNDAADAHPAVVALGHEQQIRRFSHEVGNPLSIIKSYLRLLEHKIPTNSGMHEELHVLKEEIERVVRIVRQLGEGPQAAGSMDVSVNEVAGDLLRLYGESLFASRGIEVHTGFDPQHPSVRGDADGIKQILLNLLKNASEALTTGHYLRLETSASILHEGVRYAGFSVQDDGPGIPLSAVQRLFDASPSAVPTGARGMGLSIVGGLVRHMQGRVICETRKDGGTRISVLLPPAGQIGVGVGS